jgi:hypothetical protein
MGVALRPRPQRISRSTSPRTRPTNAPFRDACFSSGGCLAAAHLHQFRADTRPRAAAVRPRSPTVSRTPPAPAAALRLKFNSPLRPPRPRSRSSTDPRSAVFKFNSPLRPPRPRSRPSTDPPFSSSTVLYGRHVPALVHRRIQDPPFSSSPLPYSRHVPALVRRRSAVFKFTTPLRPPRPHSRPSTDPTSALFKFTGRSLPVDGPSFSRSASSKFRASSPLLRLRASPAQTTSVAAPLTSRETTRGLTRRRSA